MIKIVVVGATGLIGGQVVSLLAQAKDVELHIVVRKPVNPLPPAVMQHVANISDWPVLVAEIKPAIAVSCLGTTWRSAGSKAAFSAVDLDLVLSFAQAARSAGAQHMIAVSSTGANASTSNFYLSVKGKADDGMQAMGFERVDLMRPGLLRGDRGTDRRLGERAAIMLSPLTDMLMPGPLRRYRSIDGATVAAAIANLALTGGQGTFVHENDAIAMLAC